MKRLPRLLLLGTFLLLILFEIRIGAATQEVIQPDFVSVTGPHGITVLVGPLIKSPDGGYKREIILPGQAPMLINTEPDVTPQEIATIYG